MRIESDKVESPTQDELEKQMSDRGAIVLVVFVKILTDDDDQSSPDYVGSQVLAVEVNCIANEHNASEVRRQTQHKGKETRVSR